MNKDSLSQIETNITDYLRRKFVAPENLPRLGQKEEEIIMAEKASLLIYSAIGTKQFAPFMRQHPEELNGLLSYKLEQPITVLRQWFNNKYTFIFDIICFPKIQSTSNSDEPYKLFVKDIISQHCLEYKFPEFEGKNSFWVKDVCFDFFAVAEEAKKIFYSRSLFDYCKNISPYNTADKVCRYFSNEPLPSSSIKLVSSSLDNQIFFEKSKSAPSEFEVQKVQFPDLSEETLVQMVLIKFIHEQNRSFEINEFFEKKYGDRLKQMFSFRNKHGEVVLKVIKIFSVDSQEKYLIPCTAWSRSYHADHKYFCVPLPKTPQILFNLDKLIKPEVEAIVLTDSVEVADLNQNSTNSKIVWTAWLSKDSHYENIDWTALKETKAPIYYLICNHSKTSLEDAYLKAEELNVYLKGTEEIDIKFIQTELDNKINAIPFFRNLSDILIQPYVVISDSVQIIDKEQFESNCKFAKEELHRSKMSFSQKLNFTGTTKIEVNASVQNDIIKGKKEPINYLIRPVIKVGAIHMMHAPRGTGKSKLVMSLCASIVSNKQIFPYKWWVVPKLAKKEQIRKIIYLDFEFDKDMNERDLKSFAYPYFSEDKAKFKKCKDNFIYRDCTDLKPDLTIASNQQPILDIINSKRDVGEPDRIADLVVFDTYTKIVGGNEEKDSWEKLRPLFNKIKQDGTAIMLVTHSTESKPTDARGFAHKEDDLATLFVLIKDKVSDLTNPMEIQFTKNKDASVNVDTKEFDILYDKDKKEWQVVGASRETELEEFAEITREYTRDDFSKNGIYQMLGVSKSTYYEIRDKAISYFHSKKMEIKDIATKLGVSPKEVNKKPNADK
ncbi:MAG: AAA family ATPase [Lentisphaerota bacterium]